MSGLFYVAVTKSGALTQIDLGTLSILSFLSSTILLLTGLALPIALTKFTSERLGKNQLEDAASAQRTIVKMVLALSVTGLVVTVLLSEKLSQLLFGSLVHTHLVILMLIYTFFFGIMDLCNSTLQALYLFGKISIVILLFIFVSRITALLLSLFHLGLAGVLMGYIAGSLVALAIAISYIRGKLPKTTHRTSLKPILKFSLPLFLSNLTLLIINWADVVIVTFVTSDYSVTGIYYIVINSISVLSILWIPTTTTIFPVLSAKHGIERPEDIANIIRISSRFLIYIVLPCCVSLAAVSSTALTFFYGSSYVPGAMPLAILSIAKMLIAFYSLMTTGLSAMGKTTEVLKNNVVLAILTVVMLFALVPFLETVGAALTRLARQIIALALIFYVFRKEVRVELDKEALWKGSVATSAIIPVLLILDSTLTSRFTVLQTLSIEVLVAVSIYMTLLYLLRALNKQDFQLLEQAFPKSLTKYVRALEKLTVR